MYLKTLKSLYVVLICSIIVYINQEFCEKLYSLNVKKNILDCKLIEIVYNLQIKIELHEYEFLNCLKISVFIL